MFILTGSHQPEVHQAISQTLAARTAVLTLLPFSLSELQTYTEERDALQLIITGAYPRVYEEELKPASFFNRYVSRRT